MCPGQPGQSERRARGTQWVRLGSLKRRERSLSSTQPSPRSCPRPWRFQAHRRRWRATVTLNPSILLPPPRPAPVSGLSRKQCKRRASSLGRSGRRSSKLGVRRMRTLNRGAGGRCPQPQGDRASEGVDRSQLGVCGGVVGPDRASADPPLRRWARRGPRCAVGDPEPERPAEARSEPVRFARLSRPLAGVRRAVRLPASLGRSAPRRGRSAVLGPRTRLTSVTLPTPGASK